MRAPKQERTCRATVQEFILQLIAREKPKDVEQLANETQQNFSLPEHKIVQHILELQSEGKITLREISRSTPLKLTEHVHSSRAYWYWATIILTITTTILIFTVPEDAYHACILPGYSLIRILFPAKAPMRTSTKQLDNVERIALSIGMSLALVPITGLLLNYTPWGIRVTPITISLLALTVTLATGALTRERQTN